MPNLNSLALIVSEISAFIRTDGHTDMARSTRLVILIKNIYTLWGRQRFLLPLTSYPTNQVFPFTLRVTSITNTSESRSTWKNSMCSALISLSIFCYRYCYTEHRTSFSAIAIATVSQASKLRAEQSIFFLVVLLWLCYGSCQKESDSNSIAIFVFISLLRSSNCKYCIQLQRAKIV